MAETYIHWNLHRKCWSVIERGRLRGYRSRLTLRDVEFRVRQGGFARMKREGKRNVHAFAIGKLARNTLSKGRTIAVRYDRDQGQFVNNQGRHVLGARMALMFPEGSVRVVRPRYD